MGIKPLSDLQDDSALAASRGTPILLMVSQDHCPYCDLMKREVLQPMRLSGEYENRIIMREILIDLGQTITNFNGQRQDAADFAHGYAVHLTPTLLFLNPEGKELSKRLIGINTVEMFSFYLDAAIDEAVGKMESTQPMRSVIPAEHQSLP